MARKNSKKYEQLTFPELQLVHARDAEPVVDEPASGALPEKNFKGNLPALIAVTPARKRAASIRAATTAEPLEASPEVEVAPLVTLLADQDRVEITPAELVAAEQAGAVELAVESSVASLNDRPLPLLKPTAFRRPSIWSGPLAQRRSNRGKR